MIWQYQFGGVAYLTVSCDVDVAIVRCLQRAAATWGDLAIKCAEPHGDTAVG